MIEHLRIGGQRLAVDVNGSGPLVVLAHGMGNSRYSYRFVAPELVAAGFRVANVDIRGCGESSTGWASYERADIAGDLLDVIRYFGGPAVIVGHSISGGGATIAAAQDPNAVAGVVELAPFTRKQSLDILGLLRHRRVRSGMTKLAAVMMTGSLAAWMGYLDLATQTKPADWGREAARIREALGDPERMAVLRAMAKTSPADAGAQLAAVRCPVLIVEGSADPDWADPRAEAERIRADLPEGSGEIAVLAGIGHYPHVEAPEDVLGLLIPFLRRTLAAQSRRA